MRLIARGCALALLLIPSLALATGFAKSSIFLSQDAVIEGQTVRVYTVISNDTTKPFVGKLTFGDESGLIGTTGVNVVAGGAATYSVPWTPKAGVHTVNANLIAQDGSVVESDSATFTIDQKPSPASTGGSTIASSTPVESSQPIQQSLANISPKAAQTAQPVFSAIDSGRVYVAHKLDQGSAWAKQKLLEASHAPTSILNTLWLFCATMLLYLSAMFLFVVGNIGIFYPLLALIFFYILWRIYRRVRRGY